MIAAVVLEFAFVEKVRNDDAVRQLESRLEQPSSLEVYQDRCVRNKEVHRRHPSCKAPVVLRL